MAKWTKQTYEMVAKELAEEYSFSQGYCDDVRGQAVKKTLADLAASFAYNFKMDNPNFDHERFMKAVFGEGAGR